MINLNEIFRKCVYDTNQNLLFNEIFIHMNQLATNSHFKVYENLKWAAEDINSKIRECLEVNTKYFLI